MQPFGRNRYGPKIGEGCYAPFWVKGTGSPFNTKSPETRPSYIPSDILIHAAIWPQQIWAENWWGLCPFRGGGAGSPRNTMWPGPRPTCVPSLILIRPTVWPQCTNVTDRQDRQDRQRTDSIGRTVLQTVAQKSVPPDGIPRYLPSPWYIIPSLSIPRCFYDTGIPRIPTL